MRTAPAPGPPFPPDYGPPPYEALQPGFIPPHVPGEAPMPMPMPMPPSGEVNSSPRKRIFGPGWSQVLNVDFSLMDRWNVPPSTWPLSSSDGRTDGSHSCSVCPHEKPRRHHHSDGAAGGDVPDVAGAHRLSALSAGHRHSHLPWRRAHEHTVLPLLLLCGVSGVRIQPGAPVCKHLAHAVNSLSGLSFSGATSAAAWSPAWLMTSRMWHTPAPTVRATSTHTNASANYRQLNVGEISHFLSDPPHLIFAVSCNPLLLSVWLLSLVNGIFNMQKYILASFFFPV